MHRAALLLIGAIVVAGCSEGGGTGDQAASTAPATSGGGAFTGSVGDRSYQVSVTCAYLDEDYFMFKSDRSDSSDTNGDGIIISGMQNGEKFVFTVIDNGKKYSTGKLAKFEKSASGATGSGTLSEDPGPNTVEAEFTVACE